MKSTIIAAMLLSTSALIYAQEVTVSGNSKLNTDFSKYKTFSWAKTSQSMLTNDGYEIFSYAEKVPESMQENSATGSSGKKNTSTNKKTPAYVYSYSVIIPSTNALVNTTIKDAIASEMEGRGYRNNSANPDLLVVYKVLDRRGKLRGYINDEPDMVGGTEVRTPDDTTTYVLEPGTLLVSLVDTKTSENVWEGFASGLVQGNSFTADPAKLKEAVHLIFEEFKERANRKSEK